MRRIQWTAEKGTCVRHRLAVTGYQGQAPLAGYHDIPLKSLIPKRVDNLVVAGRCMGCDHLSQASLRGAATCMATGHAVGTTAAFAAMESLGSRGVDVRKVQDKLMEQDAILAVGS